MNGSAGEGFDIRGEGVWTSLREVDGIEQEVKELWIFGSACFAAVGVGSIRSF